MKLSFIAQKVSGKFFGEDCEIENVGTLETDFSKQIIYVESQKYLTKALEKKPAALVVPQNVTPSDIPFVKVDDPKLAFIKLLELFAPDRGNTGISSEAKISPNAFTGKDVTVMQGAVVMDGARLCDGAVLYPNCVIERDAVVGDRTIIYSGAVIRERCVVGCDCVIHSGVVIGADGYGFYEKDGFIHKIPQIGIVKIGDRVEIGANSCVDRATVDATVIGSDCKIDNLVHIAHNVNMGERCYVAALAGISGSVNIGNHVVILGQVGIADHITIADNTILMPQSGIPNDVKETAVLFGSPARPVKEHHKIHAALKYLPDLLKRVKALEEKVKP